MAAFFPSFPYNTRPRPFDSQVPIAAGPPQQGATLQAGRASQPISINNALPSELLSDIFAYATLEDGSLDTSAGLWALARVCKRWRKICHSTPLLWSSVSILSTDTHSRSKEFISDTVSTLLRLSNPCPLRLSFSSKPDSIEPGFDLALQLLIHASNRWESASFHVQGFVGQLNVAEGLTFPLLKSIDIHSPSQRVNFAAPILPVLMKGATGLRSVSLHSAAVTLPPLTEEMKEIWKGVEELTLHVASFTPDGPLEILRSTPHLRTCSLSQHVPFTSIGDLHLQQHHHHSLSQSVAPDRSIVVLKNLSSLDLSTSRTELLYTYLRVLSVPSLRCISIRAPGFSGMGSEMAVLKGLLPGLDSWTRCSHPSSSGFTAVCL